MNKPKLITAMIWVGVSVALGSNAASAGMITKCQDAQGTWHYGDSAASECENSAWTELNDRGVVLKKEVVPPSAEELKAQRDREEAKQRAEENQKAKEREWSRMISVYDSEEYIIQARDNRLENLSDGIEVNNQLLKRLHATLQNYMSMQGPAAEKEAGKTRDQIMAFEDDNRAKEQEKKKVAATYSELLKRFREAKKKLGDKEIAAGVGEASESRPSSMINSGAPASAAKY